MPLVLLAERAPQPWRNGGGLTRELLVWAGGSGAVGPCVTRGDTGSRNDPPGVKVGDAAGSAAAPSGGDWLLRVSVADITQDGPFSPYPGVHRAFAVLEGAGVVLQWPERLRVFPPCPPCTPKHPGSSLQILAIARAMAVVRASIQGVWTRLSGTAEKLSASEDERVLGPDDEALHFAGEAAPGCRLVGGPTRDLNLMVRASAGQASMRQAVSGQSGPPPTSPWRALYTHGGAVLQADAQVLTLPPGSLWWDDTGPAGAHWQLQAGVGAWWLEMGGSTAEMQRSLHGNLRAAAVQGRSESVRAEPFGLAKDRPVEALQERPGIGSATRGAGLSSHPNPASRERDPTRPTSADP